ncbi:MAG: hypothetical protein LBS23_02550, partial [Holosporaceae bacterium]|nr:hypothetical protein [Holosporaceae bacterium]
MTNNQQIGDIVNSILKDVNINQQIKDLVIAVQNHVNALEFRINECKSECEKDIDKKINEECKKQIGYLANVVQILSTNLNSLEQKYEKQKNEYDKQFDVLRGKIYVLREKKHIKHCWVHWFLWGIVIILLGGIFFSQIKYFQIEDNYVGLVLGFIGVLATFIVVSNYVQVKSVQNEINMIRDELDKSIYDAKGELASLSYCTEAVKFERDNSIVNAVGCYIAAIYCMTDIRVKPKTINILLQGISNVIEKTTPQSFVDNCSHVNINMNSSCINLLQKINTKVGNKDDVIKFIQEI